MSAALETMWLDNWNKEFDRCIPWIQAALDNSVDTHDVEDIRQQCLEGSAKLWSTENGCMITTISIFPKRLLMNIWLLGGDFQEVFKEWNSVVESSAKAQGCDGIFVNGRKGWERRLKNVGYEFASVILIKEI